MLHRYGRAERLSKPACVGPGLLVALVCLHLAATSSLCKTVSRSSTATALDELKAAEAGATVLEQNPPSVPADWSRASDLNEASRKFATWQDSMLKEREEMARKQWRQFHQRLKVPPPLPSGRTADEPPMTRLDVPLPLPTDLQLSLSVGEPSASFTLGAEASALSFVGASYKAGVAYSAQDNTWLVSDAADFKAAFDAGPATATGSYQFHSSTWGRSNGGDGGKGQAGLELSAELYQIKGAVGYNTENELSVAAGYDFVKTPKAWSKLAEASVGVEAQVSAPVKVIGLTKGSPTLSSVISKYSARIARYLLRPANCPHCSAKGEMDCVACGNTRTAVCPKCEGKLKFGCGRCEGGGLLICTNCDQSGWESCSRCNGTGLTRCYICSGSGQRTTYESQIESREEPTLVAAGFDSNGNPYYETRYETHYYTIQVPKTEVCYSCGGTGSGGQCSTCSGDGRVTCHRCGGGGTVYCGRCKGTGSINCGKCRATGKVACPTCHGKPIRCPLCKGKKELGK